MRNVDLKWKTVALLLITCMIWSKWPSFCASVYLSDGESITWTSGEWLCQNNQITAVNVICKLKKAQIKVYQLSQNKWAALGYPRWRKGIAMSLTINELNNLRCSFQFSHSVMSLFKPMDCSMPGLPVHHQLPEFTQTHVHWLRDAIQPSHPLSSPSPLAFDLSQHQGLSKWVTSSHEVAKVLEFQFQHQSFQWTFRTDFL